MAVHCKKCGARVASLAALEGHNRKAHPRGQRRSLAVAPVKLFSERPRVIQPEVLDVVPTRSEIVPATCPSTTPKRSPRHILTPDLSDAERPPAWWEPQAEPEWRIRQWNDFSPDYRNQLAAQHVGGNAFSRPQVSADTLLYSQYHVLMGIWHRLDAGIASQREKDGYAAALEEYNQNFERVRTQRKTLPA